MRPPGTRFPEWFFFGVGLSIDAFAGAALIGSIILILLGVTIPAEYIGII